MRKLTYLESINEGLDSALAADEKVFLMGEDIGIYGGGFGATKGLEAKYGKGRIRSTPISESAILGTAVGSAMTGMRPIVEIQFSDFITIGMDQLVNQGAKMRYMSGGQVAVPLVIRLAAGSGTGAGAQHSQSLESWLVHIPGVKVVQPSSAYDAKGLLLAAIADNNPVIFYEHKLCYPLLEEVPEESYQIPLGQAAIKAQGRDITIVATGIMVSKALAARALLLEEGISVEVIDPRTLVPLDLETITKSVSQTKRLLIVTEAVKRGSFASELAAMIAESQLFYQLLKPIKRLGGVEVPMPVAVELERLAIPQVEKLVQAARELMEDN